MGSPLNKDAFIRLIDEDIEWLESICDNEHSLEYRHILECLEWLKVHRCRGHAALITEIKSLEAELAALKDMVNKQAEDEGLWFVAQTAPEAYLQRELRKLHAAIEGPQGDKEHTSVGDTSEKPMSDVEGREVICTTCGKRKAPRGRSVPLPTIDSYCRPDFLGDGCEGYDDDPQMGWLFRGERWSESFPDIPTPEPSECYVPVSGETEG